MDFTLRCNSLKCRAALADRALVTTCCHIFCVPCSQSLPSLTASASSAPRTCPACDAQLPNPDDAVVTQLQPSEDYKTSVLSGLSPGTVMECAGRGLAFWSYQVTNEILYQEMLARSLTDKYSTLSTQMDSVISQANGEINVLQEKLQAMHLEQKNLEQKNRELQEQYRNKAKTAQQLKKLYDGLKRQQLAGGLEIAAEHAAEDSIQMSGARGGSGHQRVGSGNSGGRGKPQSKFAVWEQQHFHGPDAGGAVADRTGLYSARSAPQMQPITPSHHRTRLPAAGGAGEAGGYYAPGAASNVRQGTPYRQPLGNLDPNIYGGHNEYRGMSAGVKVGRHHSGPVGRAEYGVGRPSGGFVMR